jgi:hypothetical protein
MTELSIKPYVHIKNKDYPTEVRLQIKKSDFEKVNFIEGQIPLVISDCFFKKITIVNTEEISFQDISLMFSNCYIEDIQIEGICTANISLLLSNSIVSGKIENDKIRNVHCYNCCLMGSLFLIKLETVNVTFSDKYSQLFQMKHFKDRISDFEKLSEIKQSYYIYDCKTVRFSTDNKDQSKIAGRNINLSLSYKSEDLHLNTNVSNVFLQSLSITGNPGGKISVENAKIERLYLRDFSPSGEVSFYNVSSISALDPKADLEKETKMEIHRCNLDNAWLDNIYFDQYNIVSFYRTKFSKTIFTACNFPLNYATFERFQTLENVHYKDIKSENYHKDQYEIFLQLKKSLESTGNYFEAQKLQSIAHEALRRIKMVPFWDRLILRINRFSNNHGLSIWRPFWRFFAFSIVLYIAYLWCLGRVFNSNKIDYILFGSYFSFIDLTHRTDFLVDKDEYTGWALAIDFLNKVISGFFIYQFIAAFRKYGKN